MAEQKFDERRLERAREKFYQPFWAAGMLPSAVFGPLREFLAEYEAAKISEPPK